MSSNKKKSQRKIFLVICILVIGVVLISGLLYTKTNMTVKPYCTMEDTKIDNRKHTKEEITKYFNCKPIEVTLKKGTTEENANSLTEQLKNQIGVYYVKYSSSKDTASRYKEMNKNEPLLIKLMPQDSDFPQIIDVYVSAPKLKAPILNFVKTNNSVFVVN